MLLGEIEYGEIFFKDKPPLGFGHKWDQDWFDVPYPATTYTMFIVFVMVVTFLSFNMLVGLTVDDIRIFLRDADLRKTKRRLEFIHHTEEMKETRYLSKFFFTGKSEKPPKKIIRDLSFQNCLERSLSHKIFKEIERRQMKTREAKKMKTESKDLEAKLEKQQSQIKDLKELINTNKQSQIMELKDIMNTNRHSQIRELKELINANQQSQIKELKELMNTSGENQRKEVKEGLQKLDSYKN